jgi:hypothetical protein
MTAREVLDLALAADVEVFLRPDGRPAWKGNPNEALKAALIEHRGEIIELLGGERPVEKCPGYTRRVKNERTKLWEDAWFHCGALVFRPEDSEAFCMQSKCPYRAGRTSPTANAEVPV